MTLPLTLCNSRHTMGSLDCEECEGRLTVAVPLVLPLTSHNLHDPWDMYIDSTRVSILRSERLYWPLVLESPGAAFESGRGGSWGGSLRRAPSWLGPAAEGPAPATAEYGGGKGSPYGAPCGAGAWPWYGAWGGYEAGGGGGA